jgi:hypothetical protein
VTVAMTDSQKRADEEQKCTLPARAWGAGESVKA